MMYATVSAASLHFNYLTRRLNTEEKAPTATACNQQMVLQGNLFRHM
jgi:hypothetical protein